MFPKFPINSKKGEVMPFEGKNRQEKEAYAQRIMAEMKLKNEKLKERHREVQMDRERAEERNSSITTGRNAKREANKDMAPKVKLEREWDRGKPNPDSVDWDSSNHDYYSRNTRNSDRRIRKDDSWRSRSTFTSNKPTSSFYKKHHFKKNETIPESSMYRNDTNHFNSRSRFQFPSNLIKSHATNESSHHSYQSSKLDYHRKKVSNISLNYTEPKKPLRHSMEGGMDELMWQCGGMNEAQHKLSRIENWVKSINMNHGFTDTTHALNMPEEYKLQGKRKDLSSHRERSKKYGLGEDSSNRKTKEQTLFRMREKSDYKFNQYFSNSRGRGNKISPADRCSSISDSKNQREGKIKNLNERPRRKCESDMSDHASSMKESDDLDWGKDKIIRARSISQSSENSCGRGREKRVHICKEPSVECSGSHGSVNLKIESLKRDKTWNEKDEETFNKESKYFMQKCSQGKDKHKYGSKSLPSQYNSVNYEYKGHNNQNPNWKKSNNRKKNKFHKNKCESGFESNSGFNGEKKSFSKYSKKDSTSYRNGENSVEFTEDGDNSKRGTIEGKSEKTTFLSVTNIDEILQNSDSDCQIIDNCNESNDSKNHDVAFEPAFEKLSKSEIVSFPCTQTPDYLEFDYLGSKESENKKVLSKDFDPECQIIESTVVNSFPQDDINCGDIYKKNMESAENFIIAFKSKRKVSCASHSHKNKVKRYSHKREFVKTEKPPQKPKFPVDMKVTNKSLRNEVKSINFERDPDVIYLYTDSELTDSDSPLNVPSPDKNLDDHVKRVLGRKQMLTENTKKMDDDANIGALNLSDDEWSTITDDEDSVSDGNLSTSELK